MLVNIHHDSAAEHRRLLFFGVVFVTAMATLVALSVAIYQKAFEPATMVTFKADRAGLQLAAHGDVRRHGVLVGQIREVGNDGDEATIRVALQPEAASTIPSNISARIIPTTLFGQKFISLVDPDQPSSRSLREGDVIGSDRVETNVELNKILADLFPLLRSVDPAELNTTLHALATALQGRGDDIGALMDDLDGYVTRFNTRLPTFREDLVLLADVAEAYQLATPDLVRLMRNATVTARTLVDQEDQLATFVDDVTGMAGTSTRVLRQNGDDMIRFGELSRPLLSLLDTYSSEYPCLLKGLDRYTGRLAEIFQGERVNQMLELGAVQRPTYDAGDKPVHGEVGHGPWCVGLPYPQVPIGPHPLDDGTDQDEMTGSGSNLPGAPTSGGGG